MDASRRKREDLELINRSRTGDKRAFKMLVERYQKRAFGIAYGMLRNREDALDASQEAFVRVYRNLDRFKGDSAFYTWFYRIVVNVCIDHCRKHGKVRKLEFDESYRRRDEAQTGTEVSGNTRDMRPDISLEQSELGDAIKRALDKLSDNHRTVILLREIEGLSYEEISIATDCNIGTVMSRLHHARKQLQSFLKEYSESIDDDGWTHLAHKTRRRRS
ncbi:MAG: sigma-70 family RNA polymerase sigma factor [Bradymonadia bacterium]